MRLRFGRLCRLTLIAALVVAALPGSARAALQPDHEVIGVVRERDGPPIADVTVRAVEAGVETASGADGTWRLRLTAGTHTLVVTHTGHVATTRAVTIPAAAAIEVTLDALSRFSEAVVVQAIRAGAEAPITRTDLDRTDIARMNEGQDMPALLRPAPAVTGHSDNGVATGYAYVSLRGISQNRLNFTLDGAPLNDAEDSALYFANFGDFASVLDSIQVQRGVGTSSVGAASFAGSVNFASIDLADASDLTVRVGGGSFGAGRASIAAHSGTLGPGLRLFGQATVQVTDGYRDHSGVQQESLFFGASQQDDRSFAKVFGFLGRERTTLAFLAADEAALAVNPRVNDLLPDERDRFSQRFVNGQYHRTVGARTTMAVRGYYNGAGGWYRLSPDRVAATVLSEYGLDWRMIGGLVTVEHRRGAGSLAMGLHANDFDSRHTRSVVSGPLEYENQGHKNEVSGFAKLSWTRGHWHHYADAQVRWARFAYDGEPDLGSVAWTFVNPKVGTRYLFAPGLSLYASLGATGREPTRGDLLSGEDNASVVHDLHAVGPERLVNLEAGLDFAQRRVTGTVSAYAMEFRDEIAPTGELSENGLPLRRNTAKSFRRGVEADVAWQLVSRVRVRHTANVGYNRISRWTQFYDVYDQSGAWTGNVPLVHANVPPILTPAYVGNLAIDVLAAPDVTVGALGRYVGRAHLDNTGSDDFRTPAVFTLDASAVIGLSRWLPAGRPTLRVSASNLFDNRHVYLSGYSYQYFAGDPVAGGRLVGTRYFYPQATRGVFAQVEFRW